MTARLDRTNDMHWVYRCFDADGRLVYVGATARLFNRLEQHRQTSWWAPTVAKVRAKVYPNGTVARAVERDAIRNEVPRWNKAGKWAGRNNWSREDWGDWLTLLLRDAPWFTSEIRRALGDYRAIFGCDPDQFVLDRIHELREESARRQADWDRRRSEDVQRIRAIDSADELALARERKATS